MTYNFEILKNDEDIQNIGYKAANKFKKQLSKEEIDSCFLIALWRACEKYNPNYDPSKIASFYTFLYKGVYFECMKLCQVNAAYKKNINKIKNNHSHKIKHGYKDISFATIDAQDFGLNQSESQILIKRFWERKTLKELSIENNISLQAIKKRIKKILKKIQNACV